MEDVEITSIGEKESRKLRKIVLILPIVPEPWVVTQPEVMVFKKFIRSRIVVIRQVFEVKIQWPDVRIALFLMRLLPPFLENLVEVKFPWMVTSNYSYKVSPK